MGAIVSTVPGITKKLSENTQGQTNAQTNVKNIPSIFVNSNLLKSDTAWKKKVKKDAKVYEIDGKTYTENVQYITEDFGKFKLYAERINIKDDKELEDSSPKTFDMDVQLFGAGYLVNSSICLSVINFNTLITVLDDVYNCFVCDVMVFVGNIDKHLANTDHENNMEAFPPLEEFGISIARLKNEHYHCAVCNVAIHKNVSEQHFKGKQHEDNLLLAAHKVNDTIKYKNNDRVLKISEHKNKKGESNKKIDIIMDCKVKVKVGSVVFEIPYYTWNMVSIIKSTKNKRFYCMACKIDDAIVNMANHIDGHTHNDNCEKFKINHEYEDHLIRQDENFSHCGTCNTIHYLNTINVHIKSVHKIRAGEESINVSQIESEIRIDNNRTNANSIDVNRNNDVNAIMNQKCVVYLFGIRMSVLLLSLNAIFRNDAGFYCALCKICFHWQYINEHIQNTMHIVFLNSVPALQQFGYNYIRSIQSLPHCGICHLVIQPNVLLLHLQDPAHIMLTNMALGFHVRPQPVTIAKIAPNVKNDAQNVNSDAENANNDSDNVDLQFSNNETQNSNDSKFEVGDGAQSHDVDVDINEDTNDYFDSDKYADILEVQIALKIVNSQITLTSYNTLVPVGDVGRHCFACGQFVKVERLKKHINNENHVKMIKDMKYVEEYGNNLIRQKSVLYHCSLCNVILRRGELKEHLKWPIHEQQKKNMTYLKKSQTNKLTKKVYAKQKEAIYCDEEPELKIISSINVVGINKKRNTDKKQIIVINSYNLKLPLKWDAWHSIALIKNSYKCIICQEHLNEKLNEIYEHVDSDDHNSKLSMPFMKEYYPALIREVSDKVYNCVICNLELNSTEHILEHVNACASPGKEKRGKMPIKIKYRYPNPGLLDRKKSSIKPLVPDEVLIGRPRGWNSAWMDYCDPYHCNDYHKIACGLNRVTMKFQWFQSGCHLILNNKCATYRGFLKFGQVDTKYCRAYVMFALRSGCPDSCPDEEKPVCAVNLDDNKPCVFKSVCHLYKKNCGQKLQQYVEVSSDVCLRDKDLVVKALEVMTYQELNGGNSTEQSDKETVHKYYVE
ncbi:uncharacterized protein LOC128682096 isoform X2 [Plodia interpunctella]|uniref:uncharacterized protein LOC128682096 isoform X2 n=1 Tax=Plodia interpunctella TaxID=58824 RepID=UPI00236744E5|nr:uncharacterized protein LOC128682096 isoform X2 [Plodia interpunctella]